MLCRLGALYIEMDQYTEADASFGRALRIREEALGPAHARVAQTLKHMINLYELQVGLKSRLRFGGRGAATLALCCGVQERYPEAELVAERALQITEATFGSDHSHVAMLLIRMARLETSAKVSGESPRCDAVHRGAARWVLARHHAMCERRSQGPVPGGLTCSNAHMFTRCALAIRSDRSGVSRTR